MAAEISVSDVADGSGWDARLRAHRDANIFCATAWGSYKARLGARVRRAVVQADGHDLALVQWQERRVGPGRFVLVQGGPVLTDRGRGRAEAVLGALLAHLALGRLDLLGIRYEGFECPEATLALLMHGFAPVVAAKNHTLALDLTPDLDAILARTERRWRKALRKAEGNPDLTTHFLTDRGERLAAFDAFSAMYAALQQRKGFSSSLNPEHYRDLAADDDSLLFLDVREGGERVLVRIAHLSAERCTDFFTASNERARVTSAAGLAVWRIVERAKAEGCRVFDHGGIDPRGNRNVFEFKRGLCETVVQTNPLWLHGRSPALRAAAGALLATR